MSQKSRKFPKKNRKRWFRCDRQLWRTWTYTTSNSWIREPKWPLAVKKCNFRQKKFRTASAATQWATCQLVVTFRACQRSPTVRLTATNRAKIQLGTPPPKMAQFKRKFKEMICAWLQQALTTTLNRSEKTMILLSLFKKSSATTRP